MSHDTSSSHGGGAGRIGLWVVLALTVLLLGYVTATAARSNPIYSDRDAYGVSKYHFIEECREHLFDPENLPVLTGGSQPEKLSVAVKRIMDQAPPEQRISFESQRLLAESNVDPHVIDDSVQPDNNGNLMLTLPVVVKLVDRSTGVVRPFAPLQMQCTFDKTKKHLNVLMAPGGA